MLLTLEILSGSLEGQKQECAAGAVTIGRDPSSALCFDAEKDVTVSGRHARVFLEGGAWRVEDLGSSNGTFVNGERVEGAAQLRDGDEITLGRKGPRLKVRLAIPRTVLETPPTSLEERLPRVDRSPPAGELGVKKRDESVRAGELLPPQPRGVVGRQTVLAMIKDAHLQAQGRGGGLTRVGGATLFAQAIVRQAVQESSRRTKVAVLGVLVVLLGVTVALTYQIWGVKREVRSVKSDMTATFQKGMDGAVANLEARAKELDAAGASYRQAAEEIRGEMTGLLERNREAADTLQNLSAELAISRKSQADLQTSLESLRQLHEAAKGDLEQGIEGARARLDAAEAELARTREQLEAEKQQSARLGQERSATLSAVGGTLPASGGDRLRTLDRQEQAAVGQAIAHEQTASSVRQTARQAAEAAPMGVSELQRGLDTEPDLAVIKAQTTLEDYSTPVVPSAPTLELATPGSGARLSMPYPRGDLRKNIAVGRFECLVQNRPWGVSVEDVEKQMRAQMTTILRQTGRFIVVEREDLDSVLMEQKLVGTGAVAAEGAAHSGRLLGAQALVLGKITQMDNQVTEKKSSMNWGALLGGLASVAGATGVGGLDLDSAQQLNIPDVTTTTHKVNSTFTLAMDVKVLDTTTGEVLFTAEGHGSAQSTKKGTAVGSSWGTSVNVTAGTDDVADATRAALYDATVRIVEGMGQVPWKGLVMDLVGERVILNGGQDVNLEVGDTFQIMSRGRELIDPATGQRRGFLETPAGVIRVSQVDETKSYAEITESTLPIQRGDALVYQGVTRVVQAGESDEYVPEKYTRGLPFKYVELASNKPTAYNGPGTSYGVVELKDLELGTPLRVKFAFGDWVKVTLPSGSNAWLSAQATRLLDGYPTEVSSVTVTAKKAKLRSAPSTKSNKVGTIRLGETLRVDEKLGGWYLVGAPGGSKGWLPEGEVTVKESDSKAAQGGSAAPPIA